jgi:hypothetical protein
MTVGWAKKSGCHPGDSASALYMIQEGRTTLLLEMLILNVPLAEYEYSSE